MEALPLRFLEQGLIHLMTHLDQRSPSKIVSYRLNDPYHDLHRSTISRLGLFCLFKGVDVVILVRRFRTVKKLGATSSWQPQPPLIEWSAPRRLTTASMARLSM